MISPPAILDGFVKIPFAALRFNSVVAARLVSALPSSVFARPSSGAFYETSVLVTFCRIIILNEAILRNFFISSNNKKNTPPFPGKKILKISDAGIFPQRFPGP
jgi:hypothetical protein